MYFIAIGVLTVYTAFVEKNCFGAAKQNAGGDSNKANVWRLYSKQKS